MRIEVFVEDTLELMHYLLRRFHQQVRRVLLYLSPALRASSAKVG